MNFKGNNFTGCMWFLFTKNLMPGLKFCGDNVGEIFRNDFDADSDFGGTDETLILNRTPRFSMI